MYEKLSPNINTKQMLVSGLRRIPIKNMLGVSCDLQIYQLIKAHDTGNDLSLFAKFANRVSLTEEVKDDFKQNQVASIITFVEPFNIFEELKQPLPLSPLSTQEYVGKYYETIKTEREKYKQISSLYMKLALGECGFGKKGEHTIDEMSIADFLFNRARFIYYVHLRLLLDKKGYTEENLEHIWQDGIRMFEIDDLTALIAWQTYEQTTGLQYGKIVAQRAVRDYEKRIASYNETYPHNPIPFSPSTLSSENS